MGIFVASYLRANGIEPAGFLDNRVGLLEQQVDGLPVFRPGSERVDHESWVLIAAKEAASQLEAQCNSLGYSRSVRGWQLIHAWADRTVVPGYVSSSKDFLDHWEDYEEAVPLFEDEGSLQVLKRAIQYQISCQDEDLPEYDPFEYFRPGFPLETVFAETVDCGAFDGDTLKALRHLHPEGSGVYHAFEPDPVNFQRLSSFVASLPAEASSRIHIYRLAVGAQRGQLCFEGNGGLGSRLRSNGEILVEVAPLDEVLSTVEPTFLKMDIEGAEPEALLGAMGLIRKSLPTMAICVYHRPEHYVSIPKWIHSLSLGYKLQLRHHSRYFTGTVCYAIPPALQHKVLV